MTLESAKKNLEARGFRVQVFSSGKEAAAYLDAAVDGTAVGFGGSITLQELGPVYITSANALAETGEIINIDGVGNRAASTLYGHQKLYFVVGRNKLAPTYEEALWRARNIAAPKNAQRLGRKTPCAIKGDRCYDCKSPERICRGLVVLWEPMMGMEQTTEVLLVDEELGF